MGDNNESFKEKKLGTHLKQSHFFCRIPIKIENIILTWYFKDYLTFLLEFFCDF